MIGKTYIEKAEYYFQDRVYLVLKETREYIVAKVINFGTWKFNVSRIHKRTFRKKMELSSIQMSISG